MTQQTAPRGTATEQPEKKKREEEPVAGETFGDFRNSFAYGARNDLLFKFLKRLPEDEAGEFFRSLLEKLGQTVDDGNLERLLEHVYSWNVRGYAGGPDQSEAFAYEDAPFAPLPGPVSRLKLGLLTASGHFAAGDDPEPFGEKNLTQADAIPRILDFLRSPPQLSSIPMDTPPERLRVRHPGYDIRAMEADPNVGLPLGPLRALVEGGAIGSLAAAAYSFVGATAQRPLLKSHAPQWAGMLKEQGVQAALLVPA